MIREATRKLSPGSRLGHYEIVDWLGAGGMGEVYRGRDPRLDREVAIKVIAEAFAADPSRLRRFEDEARAAGRLNHPNILTVYDVGSEAGVPFIVSELLEGESLRRLLQRDTLLPHKAIDYARQAAEGLAAAHDKGIVHRDVKPDNLFITSDGRVKLLDFGVAKLMQPDDHPARRSDRTQTVDGVVIGTASYMSPEQVRGEPVDGRSDIFSVGAILFEMLGGGPAFTRGTAADTMAAVLKDTASLGTVVDAQLERVVARCLEKPRESRFQSAHDLAFALEGLLGSSSTSMRRAGVRLSRQTGWRWAAGAVLAAAAVLLIAWWAAWREPPLVAPIVLSAQLGADVSIADSISTSFGQTMTISPKGDVMAFQARTGARGLRQLHVLRLDQRQAVPLPGTEDAVGPFFSADGQWIGFFADGQLKKIAVTGGTPESLAPAPNTRGGAWSDDDVIVFAPDKESGTRLMRISASGGRAAPLAPLAEGELHSGVASVPAGRKGRPLHGQQRAGRVQRRESDGAAATLWPAEDRLSWRLSRPLCRKRPSDFHPRWNAVRRTLRSHADGNGQSGTGPGHRGVERRDRRSTVLRLRHRHPGLPPGAGGRRRYPAPLDAARRQHDAATDPAEERVESLLLARWPAGYRSARRTTEHLDPRRNGRCAAATDLGSVRAINPAWTPDGTGSRSPRRAPTNLR